jgi:hypothetical protein
LLAIGFAADKNSADKQPSQVDVMKTCRPSHDSPLFVYWRSFGVILPDLEFPDPRALAIGFSRPYILAKPGFDPKTWGDLNKPDVRMRRNPHSRALSGRAGLVNATMVALALISLLAGRPHRGYAGLPTAR